MLLGVSVEVPLAAGISCGGITRGLEALVCRGTRCILEGLQVFGSTLSGGAGTLQALCHVTRLLSDVA